MPEESKEKFEKPQSLISWDAPVRIFDPKPYPFLLTLILLTAVIAIFLFWRKEYILAILISCLGFVLYAYDTVEPPQGKYQILNTGIRIEEKQFPWSNLRSFWIQGEKGTKVLYFRTRLNFPPLISMIIPSGKQGKIEEILLEHLLYQEEKVRDFFGIIDKVVNLFTPSQYPDRGSIKSFFSSLFRKKVF